MGQVTRPRGPSSPGCSKPIGIASAGWWGLHELGCCGGGFWDPLEKASFIICPGCRQPQTARIPSAQRHREARHLQELTCSSRSSRSHGALVGTFLVRSGVARVGHSICKRSDPRSVHPGVSLVLTNRRFADAVGLAVAKRLRYPADSSCCRGVFFFWPSIT